MVATLMVEYLRTRARSRKQRFATSLAFATLFFAGDAFSAGADDAIVETGGSDTAAACDTASADSESAACPDASADEPESHPADEPTEEPPQEPTEAAPAPEGGGSDEPVAGEEPSTDDATTEPTEGGETEGTTDEPADGEATDDGSEGASSGQSPRDEARTENAEPAGTPVVEPQPAAQAEETVELGPEVAASEVTTALLRRALPDPIRPAERLAPAFARNLRSEAKRARVDWALVLGVLRADGELGRVPATRRELRSVARQLHRLLQGREERQALLAYHGRTSFADRAMALTRYNRAVGLRPLVTGFEAAKVQIALRVLSDSRLDIYSAGRGDIAAGRINVRVLVLMRYLAEAYGSVRVSSLETGHGLYARPGVVSAHVYGLAVDIAALGGTPIMGNSAPGGITEKAVRDLLLLPAELRPRQVISLLGFGGPSFPLANHHDHIHVGF